ncbi:MAG: LmeA family phospholipid-binding protein [Solirubrobacteraceae bacterium]
MTRSRRGVKLGVYALAALLLVLVLAQLLLPRIAERIVRDKVARYGEVRSVSVSAFPAMTLLSGHAQSVSVDAGSLTVSEHALIALLLEGRRADRLEVHAASVRLDGLPFGASPLLLRDATLSKSGEVLRIHALLTSQALARALPRGVSAEVLPSVGSAVSVRVSGGLFGFRASASASVEAVEGKLVLVPSGSLLAGFGSLTLFQASQLSILAVSATPREGATHDGWELSLEAKLR